MAVKDKVVNLETLKASQDFVDNKVSDLKSAFDYSVESTGEFQKTELGIREYLYNTIGAIKTSVDPIDINNVDYDQQWRCTVVPCTAGETFHLNASGANSNYRLYAFVASDGRILEVAKSNVLDVDIIAPVDTAYLVCNVRITASNGYKLTSGNNRIDELDNAINDIEYKTENVTEESSNIWQGPTNYSGTGDDGNGIYSVKFDTPYPAGTYTLSGEIRSNDTVSSRRLVRIYNTQSANYDSNSLFVTQAVGRNTRFSITFTSEYSFDKFRFYASSEAGYSAGLSLTVSNIQLNEGENAPAYDIPGISAVDKYARSDINNIGHSEVSVFSEFDAFAIDTSGDSIVIPTASANSNIWAGQNSYSGTGTDNLGVYYIAFASPLPAGAYCLALKIISNDINSSTCAISVYDSDMSSAYTSAHRVAVEQFPRNVVHKFIFNANVPIQRFAFAASNSTNNSSGDTLTVSDISLTAMDAHKVVVCNPGDKFIIETLGGGANKLTYVFCDKSYNILEKASPIDTQNDTVLLPFNPSEIVVAPDNAYYLAVNHRYVSEAAYTPKVYKLSDNELYNYMARYNLGRLPFAPNYDWKNNVVASYKSMVVIYRDGYLQRSENCGKTWGQPIDVSEVGIIKRAYLYANGDLGFFTDTKAYYTNWVGINEAPCYEADGTVYTPASDENFTTYWTHNERKFVNGVDVYIFGNYHIDPSVRSILWISYDSGRSYKILYEFGSRETPTPSGSWQIRHIHNVIYYEPEDKYIVTTGDSNSSECMIFELSLNTVNYTCTVNKIAGPASEYKWTDIGIWDKEIYYTQDNTPGSVWKCAYSDIADLSKHICLIDNICNDPIMLTFGKRGDMIVLLGDYRNTAGRDVNYTLLVYEGLKKMYYSSDRKSFAEVYLPTVWLNGRDVQRNSLPVLSDGSAYIVFDDNRSVCVSDVVKAAGYNQAFMPKL